MDTRWSPIPLNHLPGIAGQWELVDFRTLPIPQAWRGSLISALTRDYACLALLPQQQPDRSAPDHLLLLRVRLPAVWLTLDGGSHRSALRAQRIRDQDNSWFLALRPADPGQPGPLPLLPPGPLSVVFPSGPAGKWPALRIGGATPASIDPVTPMRRWDWAWSPTIGPVSLRVYVDRTAEQLAAWLDSNLPAGHFHREDQRYTSTFTKDWWLIAADGLLYFAHGYHSVPPEQLAWDQFLLAQIAAGELGELTFDLFDGDYVWLTASGYSCDSLRRYLWPSRFKAGQPHPWNQLADLTVDAVSQPAVPVLETIRRAIATHAGLDPTCSLSEALTATPLAKLPRRVLVLLPANGQLPPPDQSPGRLNFRIYWRWQQGPAGPNHPYVTVYE